MIQTRKCCTCKEVKKVSQFYADHAEGGYQRRCRDCSTERVRVYERKQPSLPPMASRNKHLGRRYGVDHVRYVEKLVEQGGKCAICLGTEPGKGFDYDHVTGKIRGLLCARCNQALGLFKDDLGILKRALVYLQKDKN